MRVFSVERRVRVSFAGLEVDFVDRDRALSQVEELAEKGTFPVYVIYGPEGSGKTAFLRQAREILEGDFGYRVVYVNPLSERVSEILQYTSSISDIVRDVLSAFPDPYSKIVDAAISIASRVLKSFSKPRLAVLMDDIFQAVGLDKAEIYVKTLLNLIEWPPASYEKIVVLVTSSEGVTRARVGRHSWATLRIMWNMNREGFMELYEKIPGGKPGFDSVWGWVGGNPRYLEKLYESGWSVERVVNDLVRDRGIVNLVSDLAESEAEILEQALEDPDVLFKRYREAKGLVSKLIEGNLIIEIWDRDEYSWIDEPPLERDPELGIGRYYAWQTPLHREAVKRAMEQVAQWSSAHATRS